MSRVGGHLIEIETTGAYFVAPLQGLLVLFWGSKLSALI